MELMFWRVKQIITGKQIKTITLGILWRKIKENKLSGESATFNSVDGKNPFEAIPFEHTPE